MADFDDFELNPEDFEDDAALTEVDEAKLEVIEAIRKYADKLEENIKFQERSEFSTNFRILSRYISAMVDLNALESGNAMPIGDEDAEPGGMAPLSDEEILEKINEIKRSVKEVSMDDLRQVNPDNEEGTRITLDDFSSSKDDGDADDGSLDF